MEHLTYLFLLLIYLIIPTILGFQKKVRFVFQLRYLLPATLFSAAIFLMITWRFTEFGIWTFNPLYLTGINFLKIPLEVWLSMFILPFSSVYIYEWLKIRFEQFEHAQLFLVFSVILLVVFVLLAYLFRSALFSFFTFFLSAIYLGYVLYRKRFKKHLTKFYLAYFITLVPFIVISFIMTQLPVLSFDNSHIMPFLFLKIPLERFVYLYLILLINISIYESISESNYY